MADEVPKEIEVIEIASDVDVVLVYSHVTKVIEDCLNYDCIP